MVFAQLSISSAPESTRTYAAPPVSTRCLVGTTQYLADIERNRPVTSGPMVLTGPRRDEYIAVDVDQELSSEHWVLELPGQTPQRPRRLNPATERPGESKRLAECRHNPKRDACVSLDLADVVEQRCHQHGVQDMWFEVRSTSGYPTGHVNGMSPV